MANKRKKHGCNFINVCITPESKKIIDDVQTALIPQKTRKPTQADAVEKIIKEWMADREIIVTAEILRK